MSVRVDAKCKESTDVPFHRTIYRYSKADWDSFRSFIADVPITSIFRNGASKITSLLSDWIRAGIDNFIQSKKYQQRPNSQPWYTPECAAAIAHRNHFFNLYHQNRCTETHRDFRIARNRCKMVLRNAKAGYAASIQSRIEDERLGSRKVWRITNKVLNRGKASVPTVINGPEVLSSALDKAKLFATNFAKNSTLDDQGYDLPSFPARTNNILSDIFISARDVAKLIKNLEINKATGPDNIPAVVLKNISPEMSPILAKLFNRCLKERCYPKSWKMPSVCPVFKNSGERSPPSQYRPISLLCIIIKLFESAINKKITDHLAKNNLLSDMQYGFRSVDVLSVTHDQRASWRWFCFKDKV